MLFNAKHVNYLLFSQDLLTKRLLITRSVTMAGKLMAAHQRNERRLRELRDAHEMRSPDTTLPTRKMFAFVTTHGDAIRETTVCSQCMPSMLAIDNAMDAAQHTPLWNHGTMHDWTGIVDLVCTHCGYPIDDDDETWD